MDIWGLLKTLSNASIAVNSVTTAIGNAAGTSIIDVGLIGYGANSFVSMLIIINPDDQANADSRVITIFDNITGQITVSRPFKAGQVAAGTRYIIKISSTAQVYEMTRFLQATAGPVDVNGTTWSDLVDATGPGARTSMLCGFTVTMGGAWAGNPQVRITDEVYNKIFPFQDEYEMTVDFSDAAQVIFTWPVIIPIGEGFAFQFRSTNAADGAGDTLTLNNLDVMYMGETA